MINLIKLPIIFLLILSASSFEITEGNVMHEEKLRPCITLMLPTLVDLIEDDFEDRLKETYDVKMKKPGLFNSGNLMVAEEVDIPAISNKTMDLYAVTTKQGNDQSKLQVFASFGYDEYLNKDDNPAAYAELKRFLISFTDFHLNKYYSESIEETLEKREDLMDDKEKLQKKIEKNNEDIQDNIEDNVKMEKENVEYKSEINVNEITTSELHEKHLKMNEEYKEFQNKISRIKEN